MRHHIGLLSRLVRFLLIRLALGGTMADNFGIRARATGITIGLPAAVLALTAHGHVLPGADLRAGFGAPPQIGRLATGGGAGSDHHPKQWKDQC